MILFAVLLINDISSFTIANESTTTQSIYQRAVTEILKVESDLKREREQLKIDREKFEDAKKLPKPINNTDVIRLNVGDEILMTTHETLPRVPKSILFIMFNDRWELKLPKKGMKLEISYWILIPFFFVIK